MAESFTGSKISRCGVQKLVADKAIAKEKVQKMNRMNLKSSGHSFKLLQHLKYNCN